MSPTTSAPNIKDGIQRDVKLAGDGWISKARPNEFSNMNYLLISQLSHAVLLAELSTIERVRIEEEALLKPEVTAPARALPPPPPNLDVREETEAAS